MYRRLLNTKVAPSSASMFLLMQMMGVPPYRPPMNTEVLRDRQDTLTTLPGSSNSFYFLLRQRCSITATRV